MLTEISRRLKDHLSSFPSEDRILFNNKLIQIDKDNFASIPTEVASKSIAFIDGGQAEILSAGNFCLSFVRVGALTYIGNKKIKEHKHEFFLLTTAKQDQHDLLYQTAIFPVFGDKLLDEQDLLISSADATIRGSQERASISQVTSLARRFAELALATQVPADFILLDGTLEPSYRNEEKYLSRLPKNVCALAKSSSLFTASGNSPAVLLSKLNSSGCWSYFVENDSYFVKLHEKAKHVFRFTGDQNILPALEKNSRDALFLGYPYGLIAVDKLVRVSNEEKKSMRMNLLLKSENREIAEYLSTTNSHEILDNLG